MRALSDNARCPIPNVGMNTSSLRWLSLVASLVLGGCSGRTLDVGDGESGAQPSGASTAGNEAAQSLAICNSPTHGPLYAVTTNAETEAFISKRWYACPDGDGKKNLFQLMDGIELTADGKWFHLAKNASGNLEPRGGIDHEGTWEVSTGVGSSPNTLYFDPGTGGRAPIFVAFETGPERMRVEGLGGPEYQSWFVAVPTTRD